MHISTYIHICIYTSGTCAQARSQILISNILSTNILPAGTGRTDGGTDRGTDGGMDGQLKASEL